MVILSSLMLSLGDGVFNTAFTPVEGLLLCPSPRTGAVAMLNLAFRGLSFCYIPHSRFKCHSDSLPLGQELLLCCA
jgi:hypothetical protein